MALYRSFIASLLLVSCLVLVSDAAKQSYVIYMGSHSHGSNPAINDLQRATESHHSLLASYIGSNEKANDAIFYSYKRYINGFAAMLDEDEATEIANDPNVVSVFLNKPIHLHTTRSWDFLLLEGNRSLVNSGSLWNKSRYGEDIIIANLDTGVWPESKSFDDHGYGPIPARWKGGCDGGPDFKCNRKLIGAKYFNKGLIAAGGNATLATSARDDEGHGSHTLSTAGGNFVRGVNVEGIGYGTAKGGAPRARVVSYKVCWPSDGGGCYPADILAAFDQAIHDGVDVVSASVGGPPAEYFTEGVAIGGFHATMNGIVVVASAGNSGPGPQTVANTAPWIVTVGASTVDRQFRSSVLLPNGESLKGASASPGLKGEPRFYPLITGVQGKLANASAEEAGLCIQGSLDSNKVKGKIVACLRGSNARVEKGLAALQAGAKGIILCNDKEGGNELLADAHILPATHVSYTDGLTLLAYINSTKNPEAYLSVPKDVMNTKPAPFMASFSSRGPNAVTAEILKPDITAPGVDIIAAYSGAVSPTQEPGDTRKFSYMTMSGTSMSCPHVSGVIGSLKALYPHWSPSAIRSAIMTTARTRDNELKPLVDSNFKKANPFSYGSGHIRPNKAMDPGLVYETTTDDYLHFLCAIGYDEKTIKPFLGGTRRHFKCAPNSTLSSFNYPSISVPKIRAGETVTLTRRVTNVGPPGTYNASVKNPYGVKVSVAPNSLTFKKIGEEKSFKVTIKAEFCSGDYVFGGLKWSDGSHYVRSPIAVNTGKGSCRKA